MTEKMTKAEAIARETTGWSYHIGGTGDAPEFFVRLDPSPARAIGIPGHTLEGNLARIRLIAAAPDLLEALMEAEAIHVFREGNAPTPWLTKARAALTKAGAPQ